MNLKNNHISDKKIVLEKIHHKIISHKSTYAASSKVGFNNSLAAQAKKLGVVHYGWGRYGKPDKSKVEYVSQNDLLQKVDNSDYGLHSKESKAIFYDSERLIDKKTLKELKTKFDNKYSKNKKLKSQSQEILSYYQNEGYTSINKTSRNDKINGEIKDIDELFKNPEFTLDKDMIVYFGVRNTKIDANKTFINKGYRSTTLDFQVARRFADSFDNNKNNIIIELHIKKGTKGIFFPSIFNKRTSNTSDDEQEMFLPRGLKMKIKSNKPALIPNSPDGQKNISLYVAELI